MFKIILLERQYDQFFIYKGFTVLRNIPVILTFIDFQKSFDSLQSNFIFGYLEAFNFGTDFMHWVKTLNCNYDIKDYQIGSQFYMQLLQCWSGFHVSFSLIKDWRKISWNNKEICVNNTPIFYNVYFESGIVFVKDLLHLNNTDSQDRSKYSE